jgi:hypothetical protein
MSLDFTQKAAAILAQRYTGEHRVVIEPGSAGPWRSSPREGKPEFAGVRFDLNFLDGEAKGERIEVRLTLEGAPKRFCGENADILINLAEATDAEGVTPAELINSAARKLYPTTKNPSPLAVTATISATVVEGSSRPYINLKKLRVGGDNV